jgi:drug/metabolite transporter (DMT)-like permease
MNKGYLFILLTAFFFGTMETALKLSAGMFHPVQITVLRFLVGGLFLIPFARRSLAQKHAELTKDDCRLFMKSGLVFVVISMIFYQLAIVYGTASVSGVLFSCNPIFVALFDHLLWKEPIDGFTKVSLIFSVAGILSIVNPLNMVHNTISIVFILLSAMTFGLYAVMGKEKGKRLGGITVTCGSFLFGSAEFFILIFLTKIPAVEAFLQSQGLSVFTNIPILKGLTLQTLPNFLYIAFMVTGVGFACYSLSIEYTNPITASLAFFIKPVLTTFFAALFLNEALTWNMVLGIILVLTGSCISLYPKLKKAK